jgi:hypothetical protein
MGHFWGFFKRASTLEMPHYVFCQRKENLPHFYNQQYNNMRKLWKQAQLSTKYLFAPICTMQLEYYIIHLSFLW